MENAKLMALQRLIEQEQLDHDKQEQSKALVDARGQEYRDAKAALEKAFKADMVAKAAIQRNAQKISERRRMLEAGGTTIDPELLQPLDLEFVEAPEPVEAPAPEPVHRAVAKKGIAKKSTPSSKKATNAEIDHKFKTHRKEVPGMFATDGAISGRLRRVKSYANNMDTSADGQEQDVVEDDEGAAEYEEEADTDTEGNQERARREGTAESVLSHITLARKGSKQPTPVEQSSNNFELPMPSFDEPLGQQFKQATSQWESSQDAMDWAAQPFVPEGLPDAPQDDSAGEDFVDNDRNEEHQMRTHGRSVSFASSSSSGLFVSERPRRRFSTPPGYRDSSPAMDDGRVSPEHTDSALPSARYGRSPSSPAANAILDDDDSLSMRYAEFSGDRPRSKSRDSLFGERLSEPFDSPSMDVDQSFTQLPTPEPTRSHPFSREPSQQQRESTVQSDSSTGTGLFVSERKPRERSPVSAMSVQMEETIHAESFVDVRSAEEMDQNGEKATKKKGGKKKPTFLDRVLSRKR
ncbi:hypothetical protein PRZ48_013919 [Zasmidium cellare]|uniref:Uncharacterized protein n=1 Tax=Zasmidium cellare TaxID=395010 RepID=A0ABR0E078_ZASCE|nr:hypothetical protein PRZ48_013919 [Zasmidium cellare]